jgi:RNA polymerase sigma-70 factor (ECF subfamily)
MTILGLLLALELSGDHEEHLVRRLQARDPDAMKDLYDRFGKITWSVILSIVRDAAIAEDLVQETFLRAWNRVQGFEAGRGALGAWLLAIARNRAIDYVRSRTSRMNRSSHEFDANEHPSLFVDMEREMLNADYPGVIRNAVSKLSVNQRKVIELAY